jgi:transcriptional regulator with XRE-family HTH domain
MDIRAARKAAGLGQEELAARCGVVQGTVSRWERGVAAPGRAQRAVMERLFKAHRSAPGPIELRELAAMRGLTVTVGLDGKWTASRVVGKGLTSSQLQALLS